LKASEARSEEVKIGDSRDFASAKGFTGTIVQTNSGLGAAISTGCNSKTLFYIILLPKLL
jgi:hypothetical protein